MESANKVYPGFRPEDKLHQRHTPYPWVGVVDFLRSFGLLKKYKITIIISIVVLPICIWLSQNVRAHPTDALRLNKQELNRYWNELENNNSAIALEKLWLHYFRYDYHNTKKVITLRKKIAQKDPTVENYYFLAKYMIAFHKGDKNIYAEGMKYLEKASMMGYITASLLLDRIKDREANASNFSRPISSDGIQSK